MNTGNVYSQQLIIANRYSPTTIGEEGEGGLYAGQISLTGDGVATHYLVVAPKATGEAYGLKWDTVTTPTAIDSLIDGPANTAAAVALGAGHEAANFCNDLTIGGYTDWYLPAQHELFAMFWNLKPVIQNNDTRFGASVNAVLPQPFNQNWTLSEPAQTVVEDFQLGSPEEFETDNNYWSSTEFASAAGFLWFYNGFEGSTTKTNTSTYTRAIRRVPV